MSKIVVQKISKVERRKGNQNRVGRICGSVPYKGEVLSHYMRNIHIFDL
jgi:hypothetical protein